MVLDLDQKRVDAQGNDVSRRTRCLQDLGDFVGRAVDREDGAIIGGREVGIVQRERSELANVEFRRRGRGGDWAGCRGHPSRCGQHACGENH